LIVSCHYLVTVVSLKTSIQLHEPHRPMP
jgi:hypothetical protein